MSDNALTKGVEPGKPGFTPEQIQVIKDVIARGVSATELAFFVEVCQQRRLNPFARQIYAIKRWDATLGREVMAIQVSIDGLRLLAERSGKYAGQLGPWWTDDGEHWLEVWLKPTPPKAAKIQVLRKDFAAPITAVALWDSYVAKQKDGTLGPLWRKMAAHMLAKCAEANALRRAFPEETSGLYVAEEMEQADNPDREPVRVIVAPDKAAEKPTQTAEVLPETPPEPQASEEAAEPQSPPPAAAPAPKPKTPFIAPTKGQVNLILATARRTGYVNGDDAEPLIALLEKARLTRPDKPSAKSIEIALDMIHTQLAGPRVGGLKRTMENAPREKPAEKPAEAEYEEEDIEV
jgi:phage recombination protein Bet